MVRPKMAKNKVVPINRPARRLVRRRTFEVEIGRTREGIAVGVQLLPELDEYLIRPSRQEMEERDMRNSEKQYVIGSDNRVRVMQAAESVGENEVSFASEQELIRATATWPVRRLVEIWNQLPNQSEVTRFENRSIALQRLWKALSGSDPKRKARSQRRKAKCTPGQTAAQRILSLLQAEQGATLTALMEATGWQAHSVRGFISRKLSKDMGLTVTSVRRDGERVYGIAAAPTVTSFSETGGR